MMRTRERLRALLSRVRRPRRLSGAAVIGERLDEIALREARDRSPRLEAVFAAAPETGEGPYPAWENLLADLFLAHHTADRPRLRDADEMRPSALLNRRLLAELLGGEDLARARAHTRLSELESALATMAGARGLAEALAGGLAEPARAAGAAAALEQELEPAPGSSGSPDPEPGGTEGPDPAPEDAADDDARRDALAEAGAAQERAPLGAIAALGAEAAGAARAGGRLPGLAPGERRRLPLDAQIALAERWLGSPVLRRIADLAGRLERDLRAARARRVRGGRETPVGVAPGGDPALLLPHEQMALRVPALRRDLLARLGEGRALCWAMEGAERAGHGPIVCVLDSSSSMAGERIEWGKALCLALIALAHRERRDAAVIEFGSPGVFQRHEFRRGHRDAGALADMAGSFLDSGTDIATGMREALALIERAAPFGAADIVLITDGEDAFGDEDAALRARLVALGVRVQGLTVGIGSTGYTRAMCDSETSVTELRAPSEATRRVAAGLTAP